MMNVLRQSNILKGPFERYGEIGWIVRGKPFKNRALRATADGDVDPFASTLCLFEDGHRLTYAHQSHWPIGKHGGGRYSHWEKNLFFSASDNSDPNTNGRVYSYDFSLTRALWDAHRRERSCKRWNLHPRAEYFLARGGDEVSPPLTCSIGLTNKCNLRCEICGSQKFLDETGIRRRHMQLRTFEDVAATIFPFLSVVELNSQGDPLLHPQIEQILSRIAAYRCDVKIQHNGTLLSDRLIGLLLEQCGTIMLSLDAVGPKFDEVRRGGVWAKAYPGLKRLLSERDPKRLAVGVYPTLTERTVGEAIPIADWCADHGADEVVFHRYVPIQNSWEKAPSEEAYQKAVEGLRQWCRRRNDAVRVLFESEVLNRDEPKSRRVEHLDIGKALALADYPFPSFPTGRDTLEGDPMVTCTAPRDYIEIGLEGQISACCRAQDVALGRATSVESFADAWLGSNYAGIRQSLRRGAEGSFPLPNCEGCVKFYAPREAGARKAVDYAKPAIGKAERMSFKLSDGLVLEPIQKEQGLCHIAKLPPGLETAELDLWEDGTLMALPGSTHADIRDYGRGRCVFTGSNLYFSTSDGTDARRNQRIYALRPRPGPEVLGRCNEFAVRAISADEGASYIGLLRPGVDLSDAELWEDDVRLGPGGTLHTEIRRLGSGRYHVAESTLYFSTSDGSDPRRNDRIYVLRRAPAVAGSRSTALDRIGSG